MEQSAAQRIKEQASALFSTFCRELEKLDPAVVFGTGAAVGFMLAACGAGADLKTLVDLYQAGGWDAVKAAQAQMPSTALEYLAATVQNTHTTTGQHLMGLGGLVWAGTGIVAAAVGLNHGFTHLQEMLAPKQPSQAEDFREAVQRVRENLDKLNPPDPDAGSHENSFKSRGMR